MARHEVVTYDVFCDVCKNLVPDEARNPSFTLHWDGIKYKLDLCTAHQDELTYIVEQVEVYASSGATVAGKSKRGPHGTRRPRTTSTSSASSAVVSGNGRTSVARSREDLVLIRQWANDNGYKIGDRGRIPKAILDAYDGRPFTEETPAAETNGTSKRGPRKPVLAGVGIPVQ